MSLKYLRYLAFLSFEITSVIGMFLWNSGIIGQNNDDGGLWKAAGNVDVSMWWVIFWASINYIFILIVLFILPMQFPAFENKWKENELSRFFMIMILIHIPLFFVGPFVLDNYQSDFYTWLVMTGSVVFIFIAISSGLLLRRSQKHQILFFSANPASMNSSSFLEVDREMRSVKRSLGASNKYNMQLEPASDITTMIYALNKVEPQIVHFSGHGTDKGLVLLSQDDRGLDLVPLETLDRIFAPHRKTIKCIFLNACNSSLQAQALSKFGFHVVGMNSKVSDGGSINFALSFYQWLAAGESFESAFEKARVVNHNEYDFRELWLDGDKVSKKADHN